MNRVQLSVTFLSTAFSLRSLLIHVYISGGLHWLLVCKTFNVSCGKYLFNNQTKSNSLRYRILMFNIMLLVNKALLVVLPMCLALLQRGETFSFVFNALCSIQIKGWKNAVNALRNIFHPFLYNFVEHFNVFTMERITLQMR